MLVDELIKEIRMGGLRLLIVKDHESLSIHASEYLYDQVSEKPDSFISIATGNTPERTYSLWVNKIKENRIAADRLRIHKLDEWAGMDRNNPASCEYFLQEKILKPLSIDSDRFVGVSCDAPDPILECRRVAELMRKSLLDLSILGVGVNGHLGLNEPSEFFSFETHYVELAATSMEHQMLSKASASADHGLTSGIGEIMTAQRILFLVSGWKKQEAFSRFMERMVTPQFPASILWFHHNVTCICDQEAAVLWMRG
jgi:galactosamine-6-phosphate isomerase